MPDLSQAKFAHAYDLAISSSALRLLARLRDWASSEEARSINCGGKGLEKDGIRP